MRSPFPGVDPFIEGMYSWPDFHSRFMNCWCEAIADQLPDNYFARLEESLELVDLPSQTSRVRQPDILVIQREDGATSGGPRATGVATIAPTMIPLVTEEEHRQTAIRIVQLPEMNVVTCIELLSPTNKESGFAVYHGKRQQILKQSTHLLELDLLVNGRRPLARESLPPGDFFAFLTRFDKRDFCETYHWRLRDRLPPIPVPLLPADGDLIVEMQPVFDAAFERGRYGRFLRYDREIELDVTPETMAWIRETARRHLES
jgi:hypothetical protein